MPLPRDTGQLSLALLFRPGAVDTIGLRIALAARMPERYQQPTTFLEATLCDVTPEIHKGSFPTYRFVVDKTARESELVKQMRASDHEELERLRLTYGDDEPAIELVRQRMAQPPRIWIEFASAEWVATLGDNATLHSTAGLREPIGEMIQLTVLK